jgi:ATP synthase protein I
MLGGVSMPFHNPIPENKSRSRAGGGIGSLVEAEKLLQVAFILPSSMVIGWLAGAWLDGKLHQSWMTIAGVIFGSISGLVYVVRLAMNAEKKTGASSTDEKDSGSRSDDTKL